MPQMQTAAPMGWCATPGSLGMPSCRSSSASELSSSQRNKHWYKTGKTKWGTKNYTKRSSRNFVYITARTLCFTAIKNLGSIKFIFFCSGKSSAGPGDGDDYCDGQHLLWSGDKRKWEWIKEHFNLTLQLLRKKDSFPVYIMVVEAQDNGEQDLKNIF